MTTSAFCKAQEAFFAREDQLKGELRASELKCAELSTRLADKAKSIKAFKAEAINQIGNLIDINTSKDELIDVSCSPFFALTCVVARSLRSFRLL